MPSPNGTSNGGGVKQTSIVKHEGMAKFGEFIRTREAAISKICASHVNPARATRVMLACVSRTPALQDCTFNSLAMVMMQSAELGLECGSALGEAYAVPFRNNKKNVMEAQFITGYRGLIALAHRSGKVLSVQAHVVYQGDEFEYEYGLNPRLRHVPCDEVDPNLITHAYCVVHMRDAEPYFDVMTRKAIDRVRSISRASSSGPWVSDYAEMARKTVTRRALKYCPMSIEMSKAIAADDAADTGDMSVLNEFDSILDVEYSEEGDGQQEQPRATGTAAVKAKLGVDPSDPTDELRKTLTERLSKEFKNTDERNAFMAENLDGAMFDMANLDQLTVLRDALDARKG